MSRPRHPKKKGHRGRRFVRRGGRMVVESAGALGQDLLPARLQCQYGFSGTPKNAGNHAQIRQAIDRCPKVKT